MEVGLSSHAWTIKDMVRLFEERSILKGFKMGMQLSSIP
jgi:hypothetical protein